MIDNKVTICLRKGSLFIIAVFAIAVLFLPCTGIRGIVNSLCLGILHLGASLLFGLFAWDMKDKRFWAALLMTLAMGVFMIMGLHDCVNSTWDLMSRKTNDITLVESSINEVRHRRGKKTYEIHGQDINHNEYSFNIERSDYRSIQEVKYLDKNSKIKVTYYDHTKILESYIIEH
ncbi:MAG: hypothetical protein Q4F66_00595 [Clostridium sp.]|nr:hypothetical protein [Clostridium sp.]